MSETKHTPLPLPRQVGGHVWLIELPGQPITVADKVMAFNLVNRYNGGQRLDQLEADSRKLREPATCNAGHKSNLPVALWDCPVCTQFLRDNLQQVRKLLDRCKDAIEIAIYHDDGLDGAEGQDLIADIAKARALESTLGGKAE